MEKLKPMESPPDPWQEVMATAEKIEDENARSSLFFDFGETALENGDFDIVKKAIGKIENKALRKKLLQDLESKN